MMGIHICGIPDAEGVSPNGHYRWDFSWRWGPLFLKKNGNPLKNQPMPGSPAWSAFNDWYEKFRVSTSKYR